VGSLPERIREGEALACSRYMVKSEEGGRERPQFRRTKMGGGGGTKGTVPMRLSLVET